MATLSILGLYNSDPHIWDEFAVPDGLSRVDIYTDIMLDCAELEVLYPDPDVMRAAIGLWSRKSQNEWSRLYATAVAEYDLTGNVSMTETEHRKSDGTSGNTSSTTSSGEALNQSNSFNASKLMDNDKQTTSGTVDSTSSGTTGYNEDITRTRSGNAGVPFQDLISKEREIAKFCVEDYIKDDFKNRFCLLVY